MNGPDTAPQSSTIQYPLDLSTISFIRYTPPENDCLRFQFAVPHQDKGTLPVPLQRLLIRGLRDVE